MWDEKVCVNVIWDECKKTAAVVIKYLSLREHAKYAGSLRHSALPTTRPVGVLKIRRRVSARQLHLRIDSGRML
jgi:hypothetical protein